MLTATHTALRYGTVHMMVLGIFITAVVLIITMMMLELDVMVICHVHSNN